jgi:hypothetical protein
MAITILSDNIRNLIVEFSRMGPFVKHLTQRNRSVGDMSIDYATQAAPASEVKVRAHALLRSKAIANIY